MKWILMLLISSPLAACDKGYSEYAGVCSDDQSPQKAIQTTVPSEEKPSHHPQPAYQREEVKVDMPESLMAKDARADKERDEATEAGRKAAGL